MPLNFFFSHLRWPSRGLTNPTMGWKAGDGLRQRKAAADEKEDPQGEYVPEGMDTVRPLLSSVSIRVILLLLALFGLMQQETRWRSVILAVQLTAILLSAAY